MARAKRTDPQGSTCGATPGLYGQKHASRDYRQEDAWGKNQFNSSFPASLVAYMWHKGTAPIYICTNKQNKVIHKSITSIQLLGIDPLSDDAYYDYEAGYYPYEQYYTAAKKEKIDLVMIDRSSSAPVAGLEVKLTTLPDATTKDLPDSKYGCEIVVRSPTILFLACSICACYDSENKRAKLHNLLNTIGEEIKDWSIIREVVPHYEAIKKAILSVSADMSAKQVPLIMQPIWKTTKDLADLDENCLDVFVWSNLSVIQMALRETTPSDDISRNQRTIIWLYKMLWDFALYGRFNYTDIVNDLAYNYKTDKAFAISGKLTNPFMKCKALELPRISKYEIKNIILGDGQKFLRPERRFDAYLVSHPELFT
ncbi:MAG TPA: HindVP family restriction endonuclease [Prevotellaceae bacterium]|nr:HindVP family restriction endonuclease [Prevotellaceae bacterium]